MLAIGLLLSVLMPSAAHGSLEEGIAAYQRKEYAMALRQLLPVAQRGDPTAQLFVGLMYAAGQSVRQDHGEAVRWYRHAAEQGNALAQVYLGTRYAKGEGVPQDYAEAVNRYRHAAEQGNALAQVYLGTRYAKGEGVPQDSDSARRDPDLQAEPARAARRPHVSRRADCRITL
jgi:uncharacterized protein